MRAPDYAAPLIGWRAWHVVRCEDGLRLHAIGRDAVWEPRIVHEAICRRRRRWRERLMPRPPHAAPASECTCGIWAARTLPRALMALDIYGRSWKPVHRLIGTVSLWGEVVEHDGGWRAEFGYPEHLYLPTRRLHGVRVDAVDALIDELDDYGVAISALDAGSRGQLRRAIESCRASGDANMSALTG